MARYYSGRNQPLTHWNNLPIYLTTILTALMVVGLIVSAVLMSMRSPLLGWFLFGMPLDPAWSLWRLFTYPFVGEVNFFTPFGILFFYWMSVGIETHMGRPKLVKLLVLLTLVVPALTAVWWWGFGWSSLFTGGNYMLLSGLLVAFATLYPNTEAWGWIPFKWVAFACIFCGSLMLLARNDWPGIQQLWGSCLVGFAYIRFAVEQEYDDYESPFSRLTNWWKRRKFRVVRGPREAAPRRSTLGEENLADEVDSLLDKIAKSGIDSLTAKERARLEKAREALMKREQR